MIEAGVQGILVLGVMGEADRLLDEERQAVLQRFVQAADGAVAIVAGTSHASAYTTLELTRRAEQVGANAVMVSPPRLAKPNLEAVRAFYETIASGSAIEIVVQDHPGSSGVYMPPNFMAELAADLDNVKAVKLEDPPTPTKMTALRSLAGAGLRIFGGLGGVALVEELDRGAVGTMTGFAFPEVLVQIWQSHRSGDTESARKLFHHHLPLIQFEAQPFISLAIRKRIYQMRGIITSDHLRAPAPQLDAGTIRELETLIREVGLKVGERVAG
ncbi:MAG: dihydrodipicolinate synthase family protein [Actinobacteria bacterium]|nr:dihydrodipicolinate synthase family protein [Actinomycetota bacterium]